MLHNPKKYLSFKKEDENGKLNLNKMFEKALKLSEAVRNSKKEIEVLQGKYTFLEYCHSEFKKDNKNIINKLKAILDRKKNLETFFFALIQIALPNFKFIENPLLNNNTNKNSLAKNSQIGDFRLNEIVSQIYKLLNANDANKVSNNTIKTNNNNTIINGNIINNISIKNPKGEESFNCNKAKFSQFMSNFIDKEEEERANTEINTYNEILNFQKSYFNEIDNQYTKKNKNITEVPLEEETNKIFDSKEDKIKIEKDKDLLTVTSNNNSIENKNNQFLSKKTERNSELNSFDDLSKDLL